MKSENLIQRKLVFFVSNSKPIVITDKSNMSNQELKQQLLEMFDSNDDHVLTIETETDLLMIPRNRLNGISCPKEKQVLSLGDDLLAEGIKSTSLKEDISISGNVESQEDLETLIDSAIIGTDDLENITESDAAETEKDDELNPEKVMANEEVDVDEKEVFDTDELVVEL